MEKGTHFSRDEIIASGIVPHTTLTVPLAKLMKIKPAELSSCLLVETGATVKKGQPVAVKKAHGIGSKEEAVVSTVEGIIILADNGKGEMIVGTDANNYELKALGNGTVGELNNNLLPLDYDGVEIVLESGLGLTVSGKLVIAGAEDDELNPLLLPSDLEGKIIMARTWGNAAAAKTGALGAIGILGSNFLFDFTKEAKRSFTFGEQTIHPIFSIGQLRDEDFTAVSQYNNKIILMDGDNKKICLLKQ